MYNTAIFDLDGTLLNTLNDLYTGVNYALKLNGFPERTIDEVKSFIGNGAKMLIYKSIGQVTTDEVFDKVYNDYCEYYSLHKNDTTNPYNGVIDMLSALKAKNIKLAILTNKPDLPAKELALEVFPNIFDQVKGQTNDMDKKPAPDGIFYILDMLDSKLDESIFVGDSEVDIHTGKNAGIYTIGVSWGFRTTDELKKAGADIIIDDTSEILKLF